MNETGTLPFGLEVDGDTHRDFELRPRLVRDSVDVLDNEYAKRNPAYEGVALICKQIVRLGMLPGDKVTPMKLLELNEIDMAVLLEAADRLRARLATFRDEGQKPAQAPAVAHEAGLHR